MTRTDSLRINDWSQLNLGKIQIYEQTDVYCLSAKCPECVWNIMLIKHGEYEEGRFVFCVGCGKYRILGPERS